MRPIPIPAELVWSGAERKVIAAPDGDLTNDEIAPVEALLDQPRPGQPFRFHILIQLDDGDLDRLVQFRDRFWLVFYGVVPVFDVGFPEALEWFEVDNKADADGQVDADKEGSIDGTQNWQAGGQPTQEESPGDGGGQADQAG